jgi:hypothetical protein
MDMEGDHQDNDNMEEEEWIPDDGEMEWEDAEEENKEEEEETPPENINSEALALRDAIESENIGTTLL